MSRNDLLLFLGFTVVVLAMPIWLHPFGAAYPDLLQRFMIYGIFAVGFNILFGLTGYLSFGHAAFFGVGSYAAVWSFKLLSLDAIPAMVFAIVISGVFALVIGYVSLRRSGIYFSILTLAFAQMRDQSTFSSGYAENGGFREPERSVRSVREHRKRRKPAFAGQHQMNVDWSSYNLAYSVLTPITNGETGLQLNLNDPRHLDTAIGSVSAGQPVPTLLGQSLDGFAGFYFCAGFLILAFFIAQRIIASPFGMMLKGIKSNQTRMNYTGFNTKPYTLAAFVISGMYAGLAGALLAVTDPLAGAERMQWTASGEVVLITILGGAGTLVGPVIGAWLIKYFENIFSAINETILHRVFDFLPDGLDNALVAISGKFVGEGWFLTLGLVFVLIVVFLPGGIMEGVRRIARMFRRRSQSPKAPVAPQPQPAE